MLNPWLPPYDGVATPLVLLAALAIDAAFGDPRWLYRFAPHPVAALGRLVAILDDKWNRPTLGAAARAWLGVLAAGLAIALAVAIAWGLALVLRAVPMGWVGEAVLASTLLSYRGLRDHVRAVAVGLDAGLEHGRAAVAHIVGREPARLDVAGVSRAAMESLAENFSDGTVAPLFWFACFGLPGLAAYKAINTLDSMIGHRSPRHAAFGRFAARLDDAVNWPPARLCGLLIALAAFVLPGARGGAALRCMVRDAAKHRSPNAGWPEAALAGALGVALAGPRSYPGEEVTDPWVGDGRRESDATDIRRALTLYRAAGAILAAGLLAAVLI